MKTRPESKAGLLAGFPDAKPAPQDRKTYPTARAVWEEMVDNLPSREDFGQRLTSTTIPFGNRFSIHRAGNGAALTGNILVAPDAENTLIGDKAAMLHNQATRPTITGATFAGGTYTPNVENIILFEVLDPGTTQIPAKIYYYFNLVNGLPNVSAPNSPALPVYNPATGGWTASALNGITTRLVPTTENGLPGPSIETKEDYPIRLTTGSYQVRPVDWGKRFIVDVTANDVTLVFDDVDSIENIWFNVIVYNPTNAAHSCFIVSSDGITLNPYLELSGELDSDTETSFAMTSHGASALVAIPNGGGGSGMIIMLTDYLIDRINGGVINKFRGSFANPSERADNVFNPTTNDWTLLPGKVSVFDGTNWIDQFEGTAQSVYSGRVIELALTAAPGVSDLATSNVDGRLAGGLVAINVSELSLGHEIILPPLASFQDGAPLAFRVQVGPSVDVAYPVIKLSSAPGDSSPLDLSGQPGWGFEAFKNELNSDFLELVLRATTGPKWIVESSITGVMLGGSQMPAKSIKGNMYDFSAPTQDVNIYDLTDSLVEDFGTATDGLPVVKSSTSPGGLKVGAWQTGGSTSLPAKSLFGNKQAVTANAFGLTQQDVLEILGMADLWDLVDGQVLVSLGNNTFGAIDPKTLSRLRTGTLVDAPVITYDYALMDFAYLEASQTFALNDIQNMVAGDLAVMLIKFTAANRTANIFKNVDVAYLGSVSTIPTNLVANSYYYVSILKLGLGGLQYLVAYEPAGVALANAKPVATATLAGGSTVGSTLTGSYAYSDANGDLEGLTQYKLVRLDSNVGATGVNDGVQILGGNASGAFPLSYTLTSTDLGKYIRLFIKPIALTGSTDGDWAGSTIIGPISAAIASTPALTFLGVSQQGAQNTPSATPFVYNGSINVANFGTPGNNRIAIAYVYYTRLGISGGAPTTLVIGGVTFNLITNVYRANGDQPGMAMYQCLEASIPAAGVLPVVASFNFTPQDVRVELFRIDTAVQVAAGSVVNTTYDFNGAFTNLLVQVPSTSGNGLILEAVLVNPSGYALTILDGQSVTRTAYASGLGVATLTKYVSGVGAKDVRLLNANQTGVIIAAYYQTI